MIEDEEVLFPVNPDFWERYQKMKKGCNLITFLFSFWRNFLFYDIFLKNNCFCCLDLFPFQDAYCYGLVMRTEMCIYLNLCPFSLPMLEPKTYSIIGFFDFLDKFFFCPLVEKNADRMVG